MMKGCLYGEVEQIIKMLPDDTQEMLKSNLIRIVEDIQNNAFLEGYKYAINILEEGIVIVKKI